MRLSNVFVTKDAKIVIGNLNLGSMIPFQDFIPFLLSTTLIASGSMEVGAGVIEGQADEMFAHLPEVVPQHHEACLLDCVLSKIGVISRSEGWNGRLS